MNQFSIYQTDADYEFLGWDMAKTKFTIDDYNKVYSKEFANDIKNEDDFVILEKLFEIFNIHRPTDYKARSLSVSDVVEIRRKNVAKYYYCDNIGWKLIWSETV